MENITFLTTEEFKAQLGVQSLQVLKSPKTDKLFLSAGNGQNFRVQQDIDSSKEMKILVEDNDIANACLVNVNNSAEEVFSI